MNEDRGIAHVLDRRLERVRDPLTGKPVAFPDPALAAAVARLLADGGYVATAIVPTTPGEDAQRVEREDEAALLVRLLLAELRLRRRIAEQAASAN